MNRLFASAWVIARRDFVATVWSRFFLIFLLAPIVVVTVSGLIGGTTSKADAEAARPKVAVAMEPESAAAVRAANDRLGAAFGKLDLPQLSFVDPAEDPKAQALLLLSRESDSISAVLTGTVERPVLTGPGKSLSNLTDEIRLVLEDARTAAALRGAGVKNDPVVIGKVETAESAGSLAIVRHLLARAGQFLIFFLTMLLATTLVTNLVEEKSNKVIEVLAAAVPLDAVFLGKLIAMLGVSIIGIAIWGGLAGLALLFVRDFIGFTVMPAVGWPAFCVLTILYFAANFLLLGALFLGVGGQANSIREIQTLSMPITFGQVLIFLLASATVGAEPGTLTWIGAIFPFSSPLTMIGLAAQSPAIWPHIAALVWQLLCTAFTIRLAARLFRATVLKSGTRERFFSFRSRKA